jgi:hypothetical protein
MMMRTRIIQRSIRVKLTLFRCTSADALFSCCGSVAAPRQRPGYHDQVPAKNNERRRGHWPKRTRIIRRCTRGEIFSFSLLRRVFLLLLRQRRGRGNDLSNTVKYLKKQRAAPRASA